jgi:multicomponent Na+:H+ antiporter subunit G
MIELGASLLALCGAFFIFSAAVGLLRMPDPLNRIQTATKATTLGAALILLGLAILHPERAVQYVLLIAFVFISNPISSHALARAAYRGAAKETDKGAEADKAS